MVYKANSSVFNTLQRLFIFEECCVKDFTAFSHLSAVKSLCPKPLREEDESFFVVIAQYKLAAVCEKFQIKGKSDKE